MHKYDPKQIEPKWQKVWEDTQLYKTQEDPGKENYYCLVMFPYPSGDIHSGHWYNFGPADTVARFHAMQGKNVLHPIGFDAFGLPAENAAIKRNIPPAKWTDQNVAAMTDQLKLMGARYDWDKVINTSQPDYYKWTQWLFLQLYDAGLAYRKKGLQNWCPKDQTVLANEQTISETGEKGVCVRCGTKVEKKELEQWFFKITDYADRLLKDLDTVEWPSRVKLMQQNWIGRSEGATVNFPIVIPSEVEESRLNSDKTRSLQQGRDDCFIEVFTTRPDTLFGATYMVLAPEHPLVGKIVTDEQKHAVDIYIKESANKTEVERMEEGKDKTGVFSGRYAINPVNDEKIPIWIADYVLMGYGTGAIMAVPAHDERDFEFAKKFDLPIRQVIMPSREDSKNPSKPEFGEPVQREMINVYLLDKATGKYLLLEWHGSLEGIVTGVTGGIEDDQTPEQAALAELVEEAAVSGAKIVKKLPWVVQSLYCASHKQENRKAITHSFIAEVENLDDQGKIDSAELKKHSPVWVAEADVFDRLVPDDQKFIWQQLWDESPYTGDGVLINSGQFDGLSVKQAQHDIIKWLFENKKGGSRVNYKLHDWLISRQRYWGPPVPVIYCDDCGVVPVPLDQLPVELPLDVEFDPTGKSPLSALPEFYRTSCPKCGKDARRDTDTMDTFVDSSWYFLRYPNTKYDQGPFDPEAVQKWLSVDQYMGGIEHAILHLLYSRFITKVLYDQKLIGFEEPFKRLFNQGIILGPDGQKMSKSRGNVVNPADWVERYGADTFRLYLMFMGPYDQGGPFDPKGIAGSSRFLHRVWNLIQEYTQGRDKPSAGNAELGTALTTATHKLIKRVTDDVHSFSFNTAVAAMMEHTNELYKLKTDLPLSDPSWDEALGAFICLLAPFAPHIAEELWQQVGGEGSVHVQSWPKYREDMIRQDTIDIVVQVNGRVRANLVVPAGSSDDDLKAAAQADEKVQKYLIGEVVKTVVVPRKLVNFVVK